MISARRTPVLLLALALIAVTVATAASTATAGAATKPKAIAITPTTTTTTAVNLLSPPTALLTSGTGSWAGTHATVARVAQPPAPTGGTMAVTATGGGYPVVTTGSTPTTAVKATPGSVYTATVSLRAAATGRPYVPYLLFSSSTGAALATVKGQLGTDPVGSWTATEPVVGIAPVGAAYVAIRVLWQGAVGEVHYLSAPILTSRPGGSRAVVGPLHTSGNTVYDANGPLALRGLHRFGFEGSVHGAGVPNNFSSAEIDHAKAWGANLVRLSLASSFWLPTDCHYDPTYSARVDAAVRAITADAMVALVDLHYNSTGDCSAVAAQQMADSRATAFWTSVAARYRSNPLVAFDLYNEPHDISDIVWRNGGQVTSGGVTWTATGMQTMYDAVRATGATNLVLASGNSWANDFPAVPLTGTNIAYGVHAYTCPTGPTAPDCRANPLDPSSILASWVAPSKVYPVIVSEFGWPAKDDGRYVRTVIAYAEQHGWGWSAFAWDGSTQGTFDLLADVDATYQPNATGMPVLQGFGRN